MYEFLCGLPPFYNDNKEKMFKQITNSKLKIPRFISNSGAFLLSVNYIYIYIYLHICIYVNIFIYIYIYYRNC